MLRWLALPACYLMGAIPFGVIFGKLTRGIDIRQFGSGNIGASNVLRTLGPGPAFLVFFFDTAKGLAAVLLCRWLFGDEGVGAYVVVAGGLLSIIGHSFSVFLGFTGGRAVATSLGLIIGTNWVIAAIAFSAWVVLVLVTRYISIASMIASASVPLQMHFWKQMHVPVPYQVLAAVAATLILVKHKSNVQRLIAGTEPRVGQKVELSQQSGAGEGDAGR